LLPNALVTSSKRAEQSPRGLLLARGLLVEIGRDELCRARAAQAQVAEEMFLRLML